MSNRALSAVLGVPILVLMIGGLAKAQTPLEPDQVSPDFLSNAHQNSAQVPPRGHLNGQSHARFGISD